MAAPGTGMKNIYREYIDCLNKRDWASLGNFVDDRAMHNDRLLGVAGYRAMLENDVREIPDLYFKIELLVADDNIIGSRLRFDVTPIGMFLGLPVNGRQISFTENVFYRFAGEKIVHVWSTIDKHAIEMQMAQ